ncbi:hypothetical protein [Salidesulfovibrio brasiliensis]|uniref:hypothetical protein n=1 Tax=Salidesulfovibrio brasiliensis TaxID=221711 RepID=UPI000AC4CC66|nr:hypothetical protein [Salidesulfovibrio brasiliensis]
MLHGETVHSPLPQDLPWWMPDHFVFFGVLYAVLGIIGLGLAWTVYKSWQDAKDHAEH